MAEQAAAHKEWIAHDAPGAAAWGKPRMQVFAARFEETQGAGPGGPIPESVAASRHACVVRLLTHMAFFTGNDWAKRRVDMLVESGYETGVGCESLIEQFERQMVERYKLTIIECILWGVTIAEFNDATKGFVFERTTPRLRL
jgi:hypothetical protein